MEMGELNLGDGGGVDRCRQALMNIYTYLDGELTEEVRVEVRRHLGDCTPCDGAFGFEAELKQLISRCCCEEVPAELRARIATALGLPG
jgi:mycothiol system anti-sigma-R factor